MSERRRIASWAITRPIGTVVLTLTLLVLEETIAKPLESALATTEHLARWRTDVNEGQGSMLMLAGMEVNNSILLVDSIEHYRHERQVPTKEVVVEAGVVFMRPFMMTTVTSMIGSLPLALGVGSGGELMRPLAVSVVGGLVRSTLLTLVVVPCDYVVVRRGRAHGGGRRELMSRGSSSGCAVRAGVCSPTPRRSLNGPRHHP